MARKLSDVIATLSPERKERVQMRAMELATLKDLRQAAELTQHDLALALSVGQDSISRLEQRSDMLLSTLRHYVQSMGGKLDLVAQFPNRPPMVIDHLGLPRPGKHKVGVSRAVAPSSQDLVKSL